MFDHVTDTFIKISGKSKHHQCFHETVAGANIFSLFQICWLHDFRNIPKDVNHINFFQEKDLKLENVYVNVVSCSFVC